ncbi:unnamed protein product [Notodromas monacha]|nr:unnamed protein product [Notodromas monacha]CAG0912288.1 unnamed protein product [Notodromas monacha]
MSRATSAATPSQRCRYGPLVGAIDQGTSSSRFLVFRAQTGELLTYHQMETKQLFPREGWAEQDPLNILETVEECIEKAVEKLEKLSIDPSDIKAIGVTNQRETTVTWDRRTGLPLYNAIVWHDMRTTETVDWCIARTSSKDKNHFQSTCGLPITTYFSAVKMRWLMENVPNVYDAVHEGHGLFGTIDSWIVWNLTGGPRGGIHVTDVTNASRTMLMDIKTMQWDSEICRFFEIPKDILPTIRSSSEVYGQIVDGPLHGTPISGILGDQQAALVGNRCFSEGQAKNTYGTGCFLLCNVGRKLMMSNHGLLTTVAYQLGADAPPIYALEGSVAVGGGLVRWLRDNIGIIQKDADIELLASTVSDAGGCYIVPAFSGLFAPYWRSDARGTICGLSRFTTKSHIARAALEAICYQTKDLLESIILDTSRSVVLTSLKVDGGMTANNLLMQLQADLLGIPVVRPSMAESTSLGAAMVAGAAKGIDVWEIHAEPINSGTPEAVDTFMPSITENGEFNKVLSILNRIQLNMPLHTESDPREDYK